LVLLTFPSAALAHPDYEHPVTAVRGANGEPLVVVRHYRDGIVMNDPVKLVIYDPAGRTAAQPAGKPVAETSYYRDVVTLESADGSLTAFGVDIYALSFWEGWVLRDGALTPLPGPPELGTALLANLYAHPLGYGLLTLLGWAAVRAWVRRGQTKRSWKTDPQALGGLYLVCVMFTFMYGNLSLLILLGLTALGLPSLVWGARRGRP
jgi:hypothetical protein